MTNSEFGDLVAKCLKSSPTLLSSVRQSFYEYMKELAKNEDFEGACTVRDVISFIDHDLKGNKVEENPDCPSE
jgi:protein-arginine kinase activator protein McsA